jgi:hypothetical protein
MFTDEKRSRIYDTIRQHDQALFAHLLTPDLFVQAARLSGLRLIRSPLNLVNLVWLAVRAARHPELSFAALLGLPLQTLRDHQGFAAADEGQLLTDAPPARRRRANRHDPRGGGADGVTEQAFAKARPRLPTAFWVALFILVGEQFQQGYSAVVRWQHFRLLAVDGTRLSRPDYPAVRAHFGKARNAGGDHHAQAHLVLVQFPLARLPYA